MVKHQDENLLKEREDAASLQQQMEAQNCTELAARRMDLKMDKLLEFCAQGQKLQSEHAETLSEALTRSF